MKSKNAKLVKQSKTLTEQPKIIESPKITDIKSVALQHSITSHKLS